MEWIKYVYTSLATWQLNFVQSCKLECCHPRLQWHVNLSMLTVTLSESWDLPTVSPCSDCNCNRCHRKRGDLYLYPCLAGAAFGVVGVSRWENKDLFQLLREEAQSMHAVPVNVHRGRHCNSGLFLANVLQPSNGKKKHLLCPDSRWLPTVFWK